MQATMRRPPSLAASPPRPKIMVGLPAYNSDVKLTCVNGLINLFTSLASSGIETDREFLGNESLVPRARNRIANRFLETDCTHLLFVDADVGFRPKDVAKLLHADVDVIVGAYPMKDVGWEAVAQAVRDGHPPSHLPELGALYAVNVQYKDVATGQVDVHEKNGCRYIEVLEGATGFMLLKREALERFVAHYRDEHAFRYVCDDALNAGKTHYKIFHADVDPLALQQGEVGRYLSEDYHFCRKWQMMGGAIHLCLECQLTHMGSYIFRGDVGRLFTEDKPVVSAEQANGEFPVEMVEPGA
jgi:hypothetical protein